MRTRAAYRWRSLWLLGLILAGAAGAAQSERTPAQPGHLPLWKIQGKHNVVYILGSIHILKKEDYPLPEPIQAAFADARTAMFETDLDKAATLQMQQKLADEALLPAGMSLRDVLSPDTYARFREQVSRLGLTEDMFDRTKPFVASMTLQIFALKKLGMDPEWGIDRHFQDRARATGKRVLSLEPVTFQFDLVTRFSPKEAEQLVDVTLEDIRDLPTIFTELRTAWRTGNLAELEKLENHSLRGSPQIYKRMIIERNRLWLPRIEELFEYPGNCIVIVGAGHLVGHEGLLALLQQRGYHPIQQ